MRRVCRTDANQDLIVKALRQHGCTVQPIHTIGKGAPDLIVGYGGSNYLIEIKDGSKPPSKQRLTEDELIWHGQWKGQVAVVASLEEAITLTSCLTKTALLP